MGQVQPPMLYQWLSPGWITTDVPDRPDTIFLTFDDGPKPGCTEFVLETLQAFNAKATFFMVGDNVRKYPELYSRVTSEGHRAANHSFHHLNGWHSPPGAYYENVTRCLPLIPSRLFRPPYGKFTPSQYFLLRKEFRFILWSVLTGDFDPKLGVERCLDNAVRYTRGGSVVVFHDNDMAMENVRYALPRFLEHFSEKGFRFCAMDEPAL